MPIRPSPRKEGGLGSEDRRYTAVCNWIGEFVFGGCVLALMHVDATYMVLTSLLGGVSCPACWAGVYGSVAAAGVILAAPTSVGT